MSHYIAMWKNAFDFSGRVDVPGYWVAALINFVVSLLLGVVVPFLGTIYSILVIIPGISLTIRRLHDAGKSGWYYLWMLLPIVGWIMILVALCKKAESV